MIFPLAILIIVLMRNVVGVQTMGTFTPMLIAMSLVKTGFVSGLVCFSFIIVVGLLIRALLSKLNLLLVPRISAVVIVVILLMQSLTIFGYQLKIDIASSAVFFPIIITAWIIERASITWEEDGPVNATREIIFSILVAIITYFVICNNYIRHIMFAFNELKSGYSVYRHAAWHLHRLPPDRTEAFFTSGKERLSNVWFRLAEKFRLSLLASESRRSGHEPAEFQHYFQVQQPPPLSVGGRQSTDQGSGAESRHYHP